MSDAGEPGKDRFRILCVDGGGIRGLISALVIERFERLLQERDGEDARIADYFHLLAGTSTGGLIALALAQPNPPSADQLASFYVDDGPRIFHRSLARKLRTLWGVIGPKYDDDPLREAVLARVGEGRLADARRDLLVTAYDMTNRRPFFFKRWRARDERAWNFPVLDAALSTAAAPTYFPSHEPLDPTSGEPLGRALVDGGVFAANPAVAAIAEALGRNSDPPARLDLEDLLVVSIGTGEFGTGFPQSKVRRWGDLGWIAGGDEPPILAAMLGGASDGTDYYAHMLLNHDPGEARPNAETIGRGERYYRFQVDLGQSVEMDDASETTLGKLAEVAAALIEERSEEIDALVERLRPIGPD
jgi:Patatin-like phospholipase